MDQNPSEVNTDTSPAEPSTRKKCIIWALIISVPIAAGVVAMVLKDASSRYGSGGTLGLGVMWLVAGLILLPLATYKWDWYKKYSPGVMSKVKASGERSARKQYLILPAFFTVFGIVFTVLGALSP